jgi:hypothetical protein
MRTRTKTARLRIPQTLSFTALGVAALGAIACSSGQSSSRADAAVDALEDTQVADAPTDSTQPGDVMPACNALMMVCVPRTAGAVCPSGPICHLSDCPDAGCLTELA